MMNSLPTLRLGEDADGREEAQIDSIHRARGALLLGQPGTGKTSLMGKMILQDIVAGNSVLVVDPHQLVSDIIARIPIERQQDVVVLSLHHDESPLWPVLDIARRDDEQQIIADLLVAAWRAQYGEQSIGPRAESILAHTLMSIPRQSGISPVELLAALSMEDYRAAALENKQINTLDFGLKIFWNGVVKKVNENRFQEWAQSVHNKLAPLVLYDWLRRATTGTPPGRGGDKLPVSALWTEDKEHPITRATMIRDGKIVVEKSGIPDKQFIIEFDHELDKYLLNKASGGVVCSRAFPDGKKASTKFISVDTEDESLIAPTLEEINSYGSEVVTHVNRRRRRRAWRRCAEFELGPRGIIAREAIDISDLLDDGRIVLVEVPQMYGQTLTQVTATFALLSAVLRGHRQIALPEHRRVPCSIYVDEAELFLSAGIESVLAELRKANVSITLALQRLGQLGPINSSMRRGVVDTVGTIISLPVGREEMVEVSALMQVPVEQVRNLGRGQALLNGLNSNWAIDKTQRFNFNELDPVDAQTHYEVSQAIRNASKAKFHQTIEDADTVYTHRVRAINGVAAKQNVGKNVKPGAGPAVTPVRIKPGTP